MSTSNNINRFGLSRNKTDYAREITLQSLNTLVDSGVTVLNNPLLVQDNLAIIELENIAGSNGQISSNTDSIAADTNTLVNTGVTVLNMISLGGVIGITSADTLQVSDEATANYTIFSTHFDPLDSTKINIINNGGVTAQTDNFFRITASGDTTDIIAYTTSVSFTPLATVELTFSTRTSWDSNNPSEAFIGFSDDTTTTPANAIFIGGANPETGLMIRQIQDSVITDITSFNGAGFQTPRGDFTTFKIKIHNTVAPRVDIYQVDTNAEFQLVHTILADAGANVPAYQSQKFNFAAYAQRGASGGNAFHELHSILIVENAKPTPDDVVEQMETSLVDIQQLVNNTQKSESVFFFRVGATSSGSFDLAQDFSGVTFTDVGFTAPDDTYWIQDIRIFIKDNAALDADGYGGGVALTNGIQFFFETAFGRFTFLEDPVTTNSEWLYYVDEQIVANFGQGDEVVRYVRKFRHPIHMNAGDTTGATLHDDFSGLTGHRMLVGVYQLFT